MEELAHMPPWQIYIGEIPQSSDGNYWVSFESDPSLKTTKANIYGRCLPCIQNLYEQLQAGKKAINLNQAYHCWKITAVVPGLDECLALLSEFEKRFPVGHVYGKFGSGRQDIRTKAVVFHAHSEVEKEQLRAALEQCLPCIEGSGPLQISRGCAALHHDLFGNGEDWQPVTPIRHPENVKKLLERVKNILYRSAL